MSQVIKIDGRFFAVDMRWKSLLGRDPVNRRISRAAKLIKAQRYMRHSVNSSRRGLVSEGDIYGFYCGKLPKLKSRKDKVFSLASTFARMADPNSAFVFGLDGRNFLFVSSRNGIPVDDAVHDRGSIVNAASQFRESVADNVRLYIGGDVDKDLADSLSFHFGGVTGTPERLTDADNATQLHPIPSEYGIVPLVVVGALAGLGYVGWDMYQERQAQLEASKNVQTPEQIYRTSRDQALAAMHMIPVKELVNALRTDPAWAEPVSPAGWKLHAIECDAHPEGASCVRTWKRNGGTFDDLLPVVGNDMERVSLEEARDVVPLSIKPLPLDALAAFAGDAQTRQKWGVALQRLKEVSSFAVKVQGVSPTEKNSAVEPKMEPSKLVGQWTAGAPPLNNPDLILSGNWEVQGGIAWLEDLAALPDQFCVTKFLAIPEGGGSFKVAGFYLTRP